MENHSYFGIAECHELKHGLCPQMMNLEMAT